jgi:hypothetical protein
MAASDAAPGLVNLSALMDDAKCFAFVRANTAGQKACVAPSATPAR